jgi:phage terminase large subunit-like protein
MAHAGTRGYSTGAPTPNDDGLLLLGNLALNPVQLQFVHCVERFSFYVGGIGAGKTFAGALRAILRSALHPGSLGVIGAPTYPMLRDTTQRTFFELLPAWLLARFSQTQQHLWLSNGSEILFRSLDEPNRLRGLNLAWFWLDEAPLCGYYAWEVLKGRLRQRGYEPFAWATGTPKGRDGFARDFELAPKPGHALFRASTRVNAHNLPPGYIEDLGYTGAFAAQEVEGQFVAFEGLVYTFDASQRGHLRKPAPDQRFSRVIGGIDWGYTNPAAALVFGLDGDHRAWQLAEFYQRRASLTDVLLPAILDLTRRWDVRTWYCGPDEPEHIAVLDAALVGTGLPARALPAENRVAPGIQTVAGLLALRGDGSRGLYVSPSCERTIAEYGTYRYADALPNGRRDPSEQPLKQNDHALDATRYALHTELGRGAHADAYLANMTGMLRR